MVAAWWSRKRPAQPGDLHTVSVITRRVQSAIAALLGAALVMLVYHVPERIELPEAKIIKTHVAISRDLARLHQGLCADKGGIGDLIAHPRPDVFTFECANGWALRDTVAQVKR